MVGLTAPFASVSPAPDGMFWKFTTVIALAAEFLCVDALTETSHVGMAVRIGNSYVGAGIGNVFEQMFHMGAV